MLMYAMTVESVLLVTWSIDFCKHLILFDCLVYVFLLVSFLVRHDFFPRENQECSCVCNKLQLRLIKLHFASQDIVYLDF